MRPRGCRGPAGGELVPVIGRCGVIWRPASHPHSNCTRFMPDQRASPVDSLAVHPQCALRCLTALGEVVGAFWNRAAPPPRRRCRSGWRSAAPPAREGVVWASGRQVVSAAALAAKAIGGPQVALGRAGDCPRVFPALGGRRPRWRSAAPGEAIFARTTTLFRAYPPWAASPLPRSSAWRGGAVKSVTFRLRNCVQSTGNRLKRRSCQASMCSVCGLGECLISWLCLFSPDPSTWRRHTNTAL